MNIEQQVQQAIDEFGELAYQRFLVAGIGFVDCKSNDDLINPDFFIQLKTPKELFEHDVKVYGADAYLMWDIDTQWILDFNFSFSDNFTVECALTDDRSLVSRKTSAATVFL